jgi:thioredoxin-like negative regulator of GroEL
MRLISQRGVTRKRVAALALTASLLVAGGCGTQAERVTVDIGVALTEGVAAQAEGRLQDAEKRFDEVVQANPGNRVALYNLGILRRARGEVQAALDAFNQIVEAQPDFTAARHQRAITRQVAGDVMGAIADLRIVVAEMPANIEARTQLGALLVATGEAEEGEALLGG